MAKLIHCQNCDEFVQLREYNLVTETCDKCSEKEIESILDKIKKLWSVS